MLVGDYLYGGHGHKAGFPVCVEFLTGKVIWNGGRGPGSGSAAVVYADGELYFRYENGTMALIDATPEAYHLRGTFDIPNVEKPSWPHPVVTDGRLYLREQAHCCATTCGSRFPPRADSRLNAEKHRRLPQRSPRPRARKTSGLHSDI